TLYCVLVLGVCVFILTKFIGVFPRFLIVSFSTCMAVIATSLMKVRRRLPRHLTTDSPGDPHAHFDHP
ncbi:hypothetical protein NKI86_32450, partial [Mesorhizobium sp. M0320]|uniref:hypothetical protein n=1 Tax=Mesorhizobium sp. M0320 TaxID=2956936 RepID=UPI0033360994